MKNKFIIAFISGFACLLFAQGALAHAPGIDVQILNADDTIYKSFTLPSVNDGGGVSFDVADFGTDGVSEIVVANGLGNEPLVRVLRQDGSEIRSFLAYAEGMGAGVNVAVCDIDGDNDQEIVTTAQRGGGPHVRFFDDQGVELGIDVFAYDAHSRSGVNIVCGDLDSDGRAELVTMPGPGHSPQVKVWKFDGEKIVLHESFFAYDMTDFGGVVGLIDAGQLVVSNQHASEIKIKKYFIHSFPQLVSEQNLTVDASGISSLFVLNNELHVATTSNSLIQNVATGETKSLESEYGSVQAVTVDLDMDGEDELIVAPARPVFGEDEGEKSIVIDISDQRLSTYENGVLENTFLVSTGRYPWATKQGKHSVLAKILWVHYAWVYGEDDARNYDLGLVQYNLRIYPHVYIHYAYWHNNFGHPMSHGCVNVNFENMKWIYGWADEDIPVTVQL